MDFFGINSIATTLHALSEKQKINSNNIANAHTPNYQAKDVSFADLLGHMNQPFETRLSQKMGTQMADAMSTGAPVDLQKELLDMQKSMLFYTMTTRRASSIFSGLRNAAQIGR